MKYTTEQREMLLEQVKDLDKITPELREKVKELEKVIKSLEEISAMTQTLASSDFNEDEQDELVLRILISFAMMSGRMKKMGLI